MHLCFELCLVELFTSDITHHDYQNISLIFLKTQFAYFLLLSIFNTWLILHSSLYLALFFPQREISTVFLFVFHGFVLCFFYLFIVRIIKQLNYFYYLKEKYQCITIDKGRHTLNMLILIATLKQKQILAMSSRKQ